MTDDKPCAKFPSEPPTVTYFQTILPMILAGYLVSVIFSPSRWLLDTIITIVLLSVLMIIWYWGFLPRHSGRMYVVSKLGLAIEKAGAIERRVLADHILSASIVGPAVKLELKNGRAIFIYPGSKSDEIIDALITTQTTEQVAAHNP